MLHVPLDSNASTCTAHSVIQPCVIHVRYMGLGYMGLGYMGLGYMGLGYMGLGTYSSNACTVLNDAY